MKDVNKYLDYTQVELSLLDSDQLIALTIQLAKLVKIASIRCEKIELFLQQKIELEKTLYQD